MSCDAVVLIVDLDDKIVRALGRVVRSGGYKVVGCNTYEEASLHLKAMPIQAVIAEAQLGVRSGAELLAEAAGLHPDSMRILLAEDIGLLPSFTGTVVHRVLFKPWDNQELIQLIGSYVTSSQTSTA